MSNDWQPGDLALCVRGGNIDGPIGRFPDQGFPEAGKVYTVSEFIPIWDFASGNFPALNLWDGPVNRHQAIWAAERFIKVTPRAADSFDREVISAMTGDRIPVGRNV